MLFLRESKETRESLKDFYGRYVEFMQDNTRHALSLITSEKDRAFFHRVHVPLTLDQLLTVIHRMNRKTRKDFMARINMGYRAALRQNN